MKTFQLSIYEALGDVEAKRLEAEYEEKLRPYVSAMVDELGDRLEGRRGRR